MSIEKEVQIKKRDCLNCEWWMVGCQSERFTAGSCCPSPRTKPFGYVKLKVFQKLETEVKTHGVIYQALYDLHQDLTKENKRLEADKKRLQHSLDLITQFDKDYDAQISENTRLKEELAAAKQESDKQFRKMTVTIAKKDIKIEELQKECEKIHSLYKQSNAELNQKKTNLNKLLNGINDPWEIC